MMEQNILQNLVSEEQTLWIRKLNCEEESTTCYRLFCVKMCSNNFGKYVFTLRANLREFNQRIHSVDQTTCKRIQKTIFTQGISSR